MKNRIFLIAAWFIGALFFVSCEEKDPRYENNDNPVEIKAVHLQDGDDKVVDRTVQFARLGQLIRLEGNGFFGVKSVSINGESTYINPTLMTDNSLIVRVPSKAPTSDAPEDVKNTIVLKKTNLVYTYTFDIRAAAPRITRISHTLPQAGEEITLFGTGLVDVTSIVFPGEVTVSEGISFDEEKGEWCKVTMPAGVSENGGSILLLSSNGGAYSPAYFNCKKYVVHNFDDVNNHSYSRDKVSDNLNAVIPTSGKGPKSQGIYRSLNVPGNTIAAPASAAAWYFAKQNMWSDLLSPLIPGNTPAEEVGIQMDIYVEGVWNSGTISMVVADGWSPMSYCMVYAPWESFGKRIPFVNPGCWYTVTFPFSDSKTYGDHKGFAGETFSYVLSIVQTAVVDKYNQWGPRLDNDVYNDIEPEATNVVIYFDNLRVVPLNTPTYSDYAEEL